MNQQVFEEFLHHTGQFETFKNWAEENGYSLRSMNFSTEEEG